MESAGLQGTPAHQVSVLADETDGVYSAETHGGVHRDSPKVLQMYFLKKKFKKNFPKDVLENGAVLLVQGGAIRYLFHTNPIMTRDKLYLSDVVETL